MSHDTSDEQPEWLALLAHGWATGMVLPYGLVWEDPPPLVPTSTSSPAPRDDSGDVPPPLSLIASVTALLRSRPFQWARLYAGSRSVGANLALQVNGGYRGWHYAGQFEATRRTIDGVTVVWARHIPGQFANVLIEAADVDETGGPVT